MKRFSLMAVVILVLALSAGCATWGEGRGGMEEGAAAPQEGAAMAGGMGGAAPGLSESQLGPCSWVISGQAMDVMPEQNRLTVSTEMGNQPLEITAQTKVRDQMANDIALSQIQPGDRVVASFYRQAGRNVAGYIYKLPAEEPGMGMGAPLEEDMGGMGEPVGPAY